MVTGVVFILAAVLMIPWVMKASGRSIKLVQSSLNHRPMQKGNAMGDPGARVVIQEYSDFTCTHCRTFSVTIVNQIVKDYVSNGQVYFVFKSVGSILGHPNAIIAAEAAYCAGDQNLFWEYHDLLYENQSALFSNINRNIEKNLIQLAGFLELDRDQFQTCLKLGQFKDDVQKDQTEAFQVGIIETPSIVINGELFVGNWEEGGLIKAIDAILENSDL